MTDDFIKQGLLAAADDFERSHVATAAAALDDSTAVARPARAYQPDPAHDPLTRLDRAESDLIAAWGELYQIPGFAPVEGEPLSAAIRRALSEASNRKD